MNTPETMTKHDFSDLTPTTEDVARVLADIERRPCSDGHKFRAISAHFARWGAEQAAERLKGQWPEPITDRPPTEADGDDNGCVQFLCRNGWWDAAAWHMAADHGWPWLHTPRWQPPAPPTLKEQALALLQPEGMPARVFNEDQLSLLRRALEADS